MFSDLSFFLSVGSTYNCNVHWVFMYLSKAALKNDQFPNRQSKHDDLLEVILSLKFSWFFFVVFFFYCRHTKQIIVTNVIVRK